MKDGETLTEADCLPHQTNVMEELGYTPDQVTSVERVIRGKHLTIKGSEFLDTFWIATEEGLDVKMGSKHQAPPIVTKRMLGCYITGTDPPLQVRLIMDPRTFNVDLSFIRVKVKTLKGINATPVNPKKEAVNQRFTREIISNQYSIIKSPDVVKCYGTPHGLSCILKKPKIRAEIIIRNQNVLLGFTHKGETLQLKEE